MRISVHSHISPTCTPSFWLRGLKALTRLWMMTAVVVAPNLEQPEVLRLTYGVVGTNKALRRMSGNWAGSRIVFQS